MPPPADPGYGANPGYDADPGYRAEASYRVDPAHRVRGGLSGRARRLPRRAGLPGRAGYRAAPGYPADPGYLPEPPPGRAGAAGRPVPLRPAGQRLPVRAATPRVPVRPAGQPVTARPGYAPPEPTYQPPQPALPPSRRTRSPATRPRRRTSRRQPAYPPGRRGSRPTRRRSTADRGYPARIEPARIEWRRPGRQDEQERAAGILRRDLGGPRVLAFANPKGGVHKTTATVLAAATIGSVRGRGVVAWDDNELRGTLGLRAGSARHARTIRHLVSDLAEVEIVHGADAARSGSTTTCGTPPTARTTCWPARRDPRFAQRLDPHTVRRVLELLRRTHDVICVDTGNNVESANWRTVMQTADQLVITTRAARGRRVQPPTGCSTCCTRRAWGSWSANAVTLHLLPDPAAARRCWTTWPGTSPPGPGRWRSCRTTRRWRPGRRSSTTMLQPETRQAWLRAAAVMLEPFVR